MDPTSRAILNAYDFNKRNNEDLLCIKTENGVQSLSTIKREEATSILNNCLKWLGYGPLANLDTNIKHVDRYIENQINAEMKDGPSRETASKTTEFAATSRSALNHLFVMKKVLANVPDDFRKEFSLEELALISKDEISKLIPKNISVDKLKPALPLLKQLDSKQTELEGIRANRRDYRNTPVFIEDMNKEIKALDTEIKAKLGVRNWNW